MCRVGEGVDVGYMPLPTHPKRYCDPASLVLQEIEWAQRRERERRRKANRAKLSRQLRRKIGNKKTTFKIVKLKRQAS